MSKRMWLMGCVMASCIVSTAIGQEERRTMREEQLPMFTAGSREAAADLLRQRVKSVDWKDATFEEVLDWLKDQGEGRVNIVPKWGPLQIESVNRETYVNLQLNNTNIADVLNEVIDQLSDTGDIQYRAIGNKLTISTKSDFERTMYVRVYDITDILFRVESFGEDAPLIDLQNAGRSGGSGGGGGQSVFSGSGGGQQQQVSQDQLDQENEERLKKLRELIEQTIAPETWDLTGSDSPQQTGGGGRGRIRVFNTSLIIRNTIEVHEMIAGAFRFDE